MGRPRIYATESARKWVRAQSRRKTETAAERKRVFGKNIRLVESNEMYDTTVGQALPLEFAKCILDRLVLCYYSASTVFTLF